MYATGLAIGDIIIDGKSTVVVTKLARCKSHNKGIPRVHVNDSLCYDTVQPLKVIRHGGN